MMQIIKLNINNNIHHSQNDSNQKKDSKYKIRNYHTVNTVMRKSIKQQQSMMKQSQISQKSLMSQICPQNLLANQNFNNYQNNIQDNFKLKYNYRKNSNNINISNSNNVNKNTHSKTQSSNSINQNNNYQNQHFADDNCKSFQDNNQNITQNILSSSTFHESNNQNMTYITNLNIRNLQQNNDINALNNNLHQLRKTSTARRHYYRNNHIYHLQNSINPENQIIQPIINFQSIANQKAKDLIRKSLTKDFKSVTQINPYTKKQYLYHQKRIQHKNLKQLQETKRIQKLKNIIKPCQIASFPLTARSHKSNQKLQLLKPNTQSFKRNISFTADSTNRKKLVSFQKIKKNKKLQELIPWQTQIDLNHNQQEHYF